jgi:uncharacterized membrane protein YcgQ (UPF0703/DUF1980 family)
MNSDKSLKYKTKFAQHVDRMQRQKKQNSKTIKRLQTDWMREVGKMSDETTGQMGTEQTNK